MDQAEIYLRHEIALLEEVLEDAHIHGHIANSLYAEGRRDSLYRLCKYTRYNYLLPLFKKGAKDENL